MAASTDLLFHLKGNAADLNRAFGSAGGAVDKFKQVAKTAMVAVGASVAATAAVGIKEFASFEKGMNEVFTLLPGISGDAMDKMSKQALEVAQDMGVLPDDVVPALYQSLSAGVPQDNVFDFMRVAAQTSIGGVTDLSTAVDGMTTILNAWGLSADKAEAASDALFTGMRLGKTTVGELSQSLGGVAPIAAELGVSFQDVIANAATLTAQGMNTAEAMNRQRAAMVSLLRPTVEMEDALKAIGFQTGRAAIQSLGFQGTIEALRNHADSTGQEMVTLTGRVEGAGAILGLTGANAAKARSNLEELGQSTGATSAAFAQMDQGLSRSWERIKVSISTALVQIGARLAPFVEQFLDWFTKHLPGALDWTIGAFDVMIRAVQQHVIPFIQNIIEGVRMLAGWFKDNLPVAIAIAGAALAALIVAAGPVTVALGAVAGAIAVIGSGAREDKEDVKEFTAALMTLGDTADDNAFILQEFNERNENIVPTLNKLGVSVGDVREAMSLSKDELDKWIDSVTEQRRAAGVSRKELEGFHSTTRELWEEHQKATVEADRLTAAMEAEAEAAAIAEQSLAAVAADAEAVATATDLMGRHVSRVAEVHFPPTIDITKALSATFVDLSDTSKEKLSEMEGAVAKHTQNSLDILGGAVDEIEITAEEMYTALVEQMEQQERFKTAMQQLMDAGMFALVDELVKQGPKATAAAEELVNDLDTAFEMEQILRDNATVGTKAFYGELTGSFAKSKMTSAGWNQRKWILEGMDMQNTMTNQGTAAGNWLTTSLLSSQNQSKLRSAGAQIGGWIAEQIRISIDTSGVGEGVVIRGSGPPIVGLQHGTQYWRGGLALVGEAGPELVDLPRGSKVYSNEQSKPMITDMLGGGGGDIHIHVSGHVTTERDLVEHIARALRKREFARTGARI